MLEGKGECIPTWAHGQRNLMAITNGLMLQGLGMSTALDLHLPDFRGFKECYNLQMYT